MNRRNKIDGININEITQTNKKNKMDKINDRNHNEMNNI